MHAIIRQKKKLNGSTSLWIHINAIYLLDKVSVIENTNEGRLFFFFFTSITTFSSFVFVCQRVNISVFKSSVLNELNEWLAEKKNTIYRKKAVAIEHPWRFPVGRAYSDNGSFWFWKNNIDGYFSWIDVGLISLIFTLKEHFFYRLSWHENPQMFDSQWHHPIKRQRTRYGFVSTIVRLHHTERSITTFTHRARINVCCRWTQAL